MSGLLTDYMKHGSGAPSGAPSVPAGETAYYYDETNDVFYVWKTGASAWHTAGGGASTMAVVSSQTLGSAAASVTFSSIPSGYSHLQLWLAIRGDAAAVSGDLNIRVNGDTATHYAIAGLQSSGSSAFAFNTTGQTSALLMSQADEGSASASSVAALVVDFPFYTGSLWKGIRSSGHSGSGANRSGNWAGEWQQTAAITSLTVFFTSGNVASGSTAILYGIN